MHRRILTSALTLLCATTAAATARASTNVSISGSGSGLVSDTAGDEWTMDTKWGDIGAYYSTGYDIYSNYNGSTKYEKVSGEVGAVIFDDNVAFADVSLKASAGKSSTLKGDCDLYVFGAHLVNIDNLTLNGGGTSSVSVTLAEFTSGAVSYSANGNWSLGGGELSVGVDVTASVDADMSFVGVPLVFSAGASGEVGIAASGTASYNSSTGVSSIDFSGEPYAELNLVGSAGIGTGVASVGVSGTLTLLHVGVPVTNTLSLTPSNSTSGVMQYSTSGYLTLSSLGGDIGLYLYVWPVTYTYTLFDWDGITWANKLLFTDSVPVASSPKVTISGTNATFSYIYADANPESGSMIRWYRANDANGSGSMQWPIPGKTFALSAIDNEKYLRACVTPKNGVNWGTEVCSEWSAVGPVFLAYKDSSYGGSSVSVAYQRNDRDHCFNVSDLGSGWNDEISSLKLNNPSGCNTVMYLWKDANCSGTAQARFAGPTQSQNTISSLSSTFGSSWNDELSSFKISSCEEVSASDVSISFSGQMLNGVYDLQTNALIDVDASTGRWSTATSSSGANATDFIGGTVTGMLPFVAGTYLRFCVRPQAFISSGTEVCSAWTDAPGVVFYKNSEYGGTSMTLGYKQWPSGTCVNMTDLGSTWNDQVGSLTVHAPASSSATLYLYKDAGCTGTAATRTAAANGSAGASNADGGFGTGWNDAISSFKVVY